MMNTLYCSSFVLLAASLLMSSVSNAWMTTPVVQNVASTALFVTRNSNSRGVTADTSTTEQDADFMRWAKASRSAQTEDRTVELGRPLGLILAQDERGNVYVETVAPRGNAARSGKIQQGDIITMCSATFGNDMWSTRGVGLERVLAAIRVRSGATVRLVVESPNQYQVKKKTTAAQIKAQEEAAKAAQAKKDALLAELDQDEEKLKKKWFRLF